MMRYVVDTNVPVVANNQIDQDGKQPSLSCRASAVEFLQKALSSGVILLDLAGEIQREYSRHLSPKGQPRVGDLFYKAVLNSHPEKILRHDLPLLEDGNYQHLPQSLVDANFDPSDRKFAALAVFGKGKIFNATDSDWIEHASKLREANIKVENLCGCNRQDWFVEQ
jgi:hypothetical protein